MIGGFSHKFNKILFFFLNYSKIITGVKEFDVMPELQNLTSIIESNPNDSALTKRSIRLYKNKK